MHDTPCIHIVNEYLPCSKENFSATGWRGLGCPVAQGIDRDDGLWAVLDSSLGRKWRPLAIPVGTDS